MKFLWWLNDQMAKALQPFSNLTIQPYVLYILFCKLSKYIFQANTLFTKLQYTPAGLHHGHGQIFTQIQLLYNLQNIKYNFLTFLVLDFHLQNIFQVI